MNKKRLVAFSALGIGLSTVDYINVDKPLDYNFNLTEERIIHLQDKINEGLVIFLKRIDVALEMIKEFKELQDIINEEMFKLKEKFKSSRFFEINIDSNMNIIFSYLDELFILSGQWAALSVDYPETFKNVDKELMDFYDEYMKDSSSCNTDEDYKIMGREVRDGYSLFDLSIHHYKKIFKK